MFRVPDSSIASMGNVGGVLVPVSVDLNCPECKQRVSFTITWNVQQQQGMPTRSRCPRCGELVTFIRLGDNPNPRLFVDAEPVGREPVPGLDKVPDALLPDSVKRAYRSALNVFSIGEAEATATTCRRVLEGIVRQLVAEDTRKRTPLAQSLKVLAGASDTLARPLLDLSETLKDGGNLGAHFDEEIATTIDDARAMLDLLDLLITYLFVVPEQVAEFRRRTLGESAISEAERA